MPNSRHSEAIVSPSLSRITNRIRSSITEHSFHGILLSAPFGPKSVTHVSGTFCYLCLGTDRSDLQRIRVPALFGPATPEPVTFVSVKLPPRWLRLPEDGVSVPSTHRSSGS